jgi:membrane-associated HD superfamily phosphohydrolase
MLSRGKPRPVSRVTTVAFGTALAALLLIALFPIFPRQFTIRVGDVAARTVRSPRSVSFESSYLTQQRREDAANAVRPSLVFDPSVRTAQLDQYDKAMAQVTQIRAQSDLARKRDALTALQISPRSVDTALALTDERWQAIVSEGRRVLAQELGVSLDDTSAT